jgi:hypothetical protein
MADLKISQLTAATTPLAGTEVLPIVQSGVTKKVATDDLTVKNIRSNATSGLLQVAGPAAAATRVMTTPDANFTVARTDAGQTFTGDQQINGLLSLNTASGGLQTNRSMSFLTTGASVQYISHSTSDGNGDSYMEYGYDGTKIGSITQSGTTGVLYNVASDYRMKTVIGSVADSGPRIDALEPVEYTWNSDGSRARGFLAHKFQEVYPNSVTGEKDAVDKNGNPVYQNMQASTSEMIADLVAEIKNLRVRVAALEAKG